MDIFASSVCLPTPCDLCNFTAPTCGPASCKAQASRPNQTTRTAYWICLLQEHIGDGIPAPLYSTQSAKEESPPNVEEEQTCATSHGPTTHRDRERMHVHAQTTEPGPTISIS
jgi:hypothetical protein